MLKITQNLVPPGATGRRPGKRMTVRSLTVHSTGNPKSTAKNETDNIRNHDPFKKVSFHYAVDENGAYQAIPDNETAWHAGDGPKGEGNNTSIGIEICESGDRRKTLDNAVELFKILMKKYNLPISAVRQHHFWSGKDCPRILRNPEFIKDSMDWEWFIAQLPEEDIEMVRKIKIKINGIVTEVDSINKEGSEYVQLRDLSTGVITVGYDTTLKMPTVIVKK